MADIRGKEGVNFLGGRGVNASDPKNDKDVVNLRTLKVHIAAISGSTSTGSTSVSVSSIGNGYPVYAGLNAGTYEFRSFSALTPNLLLYCGDTITYALNDNIVINGLTATTITAGTIDAGLYLSAGTPLQQYFDRYWTASTGNNSLIRKVGNHLSSGAHSIISAGKSNVNTNGNYSGIFAGSGNTIINSHYSTIINGFLNRINEPSAKHNLISNGFLNTIESSPVGYNSILNSKNSLIAYSDFSGIFGGSGNTIYANGGFSVMLGGQNNRIQTNNNVSSLGGKNNLILGSYYGFTIGGYNNIVYSTNGSAIGGSNNVVQSIYSTIINGKNITLNQAYTVAVPYLRIANASVGGTYMLTIDNSGYVFKQSIPGGTGYISGATNIGGTHGIFSDINLGILRFKSLSGGSNIIITSSSTENAISLSPNIAINNLFVSGNTILSSTTAMTMTVLNLSGSGNQMVVVNNFGVLSGQSIPTPGLGGFGTITNATNTGSTHGIYAGLSGSSILVFKALSGGSNIIITSSSTENAISLSPNIAINSLTASGNSVFTGTLSGGSSFSANTLHSGSTNLYNIFSPLGHTHPLTDITGGNLGDTIRHNGTNWIANNFLYNPGHKVSINNTNLNSTFSIYSTGSTTATTSFLIYNNRNERLLSFWANGLMELNPLSTFGTEVGTPFSNVWPEKSIYPSRLFVQDWTDSNSTTTGKTTVLIQGNIGNAARGNTALWVRQNIDGSPDAVAVFEHSNAFGSTALDNSSIIRVIGGRFGVLKTGLTINSDCITAFGTGSIDSNSQVLISLQNRTNMSSFNALRLIDNNNGQLLKVRGDAEVTIRSLTGLTTQMVVADSGGILSVQSIPSAGSGGIGTIDAAVNTGSTHGIFAGLSGSSVLVFKSLSGGSNIIIASSSTENSIALSPNVFVTSLSAGTLSGGTIFSGQTPLSQIIIFEAARYWTASTGNRAIITNNQTGNIASGSYGISAGRLNKNYGNVSTIIGGRNSTLYDSYSFIGAGYTLKGKSKYNFLGTGKLNTIYTSSLYGSIINGRGNKLTGHSATIINGYGHIINIPGVGTPQYLVGATIAGGRLNSILFKGQSFIGAGAYNKISGDSSFRSFIGAGSSNVIYGTRSFIGAGYGNKIFGSQSSILSSINSIILDNESSIISSMGSTISGTSTGRNVIVGGISHNILNSSYLSIIGLGLLNTINSSPFGVITSGSGNTIANSSFSKVLNGVSNTITSSSYSFTNNGRNNSLTSANKSFIINGEKNTISAAGGNIYGFIGNGSGNTILSYSFGSILNGKSNTVRNIFSTILNGLRNYMSGTYSIIGSGIDNSNVGQKATAIIAGSGNTLSTYVANSNYSLIGTGQNNQIQGNPFGIILGGLRNNLGNGFSWFSKHNIIIGGVGNYITKSSGSTIVNGDNNSITPGGLTDSRNNNVFNGTRHVITNSSFSTILNGINNNINTANHSIILNGVDNLISNVTGSSIVSGSFINAISGDTAYAKHLAVVSNTHLLNFAGGGTQYLIVDNSGLIGVSGGTGGGGGGSTVNNGINTFTAGTSNFQSVNVTALTINTLTASGSSVFTGTLSGGSSFSANTINSGSTNLYSIFAPIGSNTLTYVQPGLNTYTGGTSTNPTINVSGLTIDNINSSGNSIFNTLSAYTFTANTITASTVSANTLYVSGYLNQTQQSYLSSTFSTTSSSLVDVTGLSFSIQPYEVWQFNISGQMSGSTANGQNHAISIPSNSILRTIDISNTNAVTSFRTSILNSNDIQSSTICTVANTLLGFEIKGTISGSSTSGLVQFRLKANTAGNTESIQDGTYLIAQRIR